MLDDYGRTAADRKRKEEENLYNAVKSGRIRLQDLNDQGRQALGNHLDRKLEPQKTDQEIRSRRAAVANQAAFASREEPKKSNWFVDSQKKIYDTVFKPVEDKLWRFSTSAADELTLGQGKKLADQIPDSHPAKQLDPFRKALQAPTTAADQAADIAGSLYGMAAPIGAAYKTTGKLGEGVFKALSKGNDLGKAGKYLEDAAKGAGAMLGYETAKEGLDAAINPDDKTLGERLQNIGIGTAAGTVGDPLARLAGSGISKLIERLKKTPATEQNVKKLLEAAELLKKKPTSEDVVPTGKALTPEQLRLEEVKTRFNVNDELAQDFMNVYNKKMQELGSKPKPPIPVPLQNAVGLPVPQPGRFLSELPVAAKTQEKVVPIKGTSEMLGRGKAELSSINSSPAPVLEKGKPKINADELASWETGSESKYGINPLSMKDISGAAAYGNDVTRNFKQAFGSDYQAIKEKVLDPFDAAKKAYADLQKTWTDKLKKEVVDKLGITKGNKLSALVQQYGEKEISLDDLKTVTKDWEKVVEADKWFRNAYDELINMVNATRAKIYPNSPEKLVPRRNDYYRHFQEFSGLTGLKNIFDTPAQIDPKLVGTSEFTLPKSKFQGFMQKRGLGPFKRDAVGGFLEYLPGASYATHIDPHIDVFKGITNELRDSTGETRHLNNFINYLDKFSQDLAGKTNPIDRVPQDMIPGGRAAFQALNWLNKRVKANVILGNAGSTLAQLANIPVGVGFAKQHSIKGVEMTLKSLMPGMKNEALEQSGFMSERYARKLYRQFDTKLIEQPKRLAEWLMETTERVGAEFVWNSVYTKGLADGVKNPIKYADDETRRLIAGRGIGEVPLAQKSKMVQLFMPFTLEVANLWKVQKDFIKAKDFGGLITLYMGAYLLNKGMENTRGSGILFDPIDAIADAATAEDLTPVQRAGILAGEVLTNLPTGSFLTNQLYPEYGKTVDVPGLGKMDLPTRQELFGNNDPTRFGSGLNLTKGIQDPLFKLLLPWGGNQLSKTLQGLEANKKGAVYTKDGSQVMYPVGEDAYSRGQNLLFGKYSTQDAREYYDKNRRPLSEKQTAQFERASDPQKLYNTVIKNREIEKLRRSMDEIKKSRELDREEKKKKLDLLIEKLKVVKNR